MPADMTTAHLHRLLTCLLLALGTTCLTATAQQRHHSVMVGGGLADVLDTYLSPYSYKGGGVQLMRETQRPVTSRLWRDDSVRTTFQTLLDLNAAWTENPAGNVNELAGGLRYAMGWLYALPALQPSLRHPQQSLQLAFGPMLSTYLGGVYNDRNGNNPAQGKADLMLDLTVQATYRFPLLHRYCQLRYQAVVPFVGVAFSPNYGQSYYEMFTLGQTDHNVVLANVGNMPSMRHLLTLDFPLRRTGTATMLRLGYAGEFMQSTFNKLDYHSYTHSFMIGFTKTFQRL